MNRCSTDCRQSGDNSAIEPKCSLQTSCEGERVVRHRRFRRHGLRYWKACSGYSEGNVEPYYRLLPPCCRAMMWSIWNGSRQSGNGIPQYSHRFCARDLTFRTSGGFTAGALYLRVPSGKPSRYPRANSCPVPLPRRLRAHPRGIARRAGSGDRHPSVQSQAIDDIEERMNPSRCSTG
jgi:hypothetical protein